MHTAGISCTAHSFYEPQPGLVKSSGFNNALKTALPVTMGFAGLPADTFDAFLPALLVSRRATSTTFTTPAKSQNGMR